MNWPTKGHENLTTFVRENLQLIKVEVGEWI